MAPRKTKVQVEQPELATPGYEEIAVRAYEIHEAGGGEGPLDDWLRAERELVGDAGLGRTEIAA
ncbi:MAG TPA: DUF2934 domain-containing protein [Gaiellaceae bacterium]|jgi:hypothetical protein|nr:DUF2934 domain-containing protein [Gaiellaceae bacterium]